MKAAQGATDGGRREAAEVMAITALSFLASDPEQLGRFLAITGIGPDQVREAARDPSFLAGVLDYLASDEPLLLAFARDAGVAPVEVDKARAALARPWERDTP